MVVKKKNKKKPLSKKIEDREHELLDFDELLYEATDIDDRSKSLWIEIYTNAVEDRERVSVLYTDIFMEMKGNPQGHAVYGPLVTKYLEKMAKSNDQLLKLAEQIAVYRKDDANIDAEDLLNQIEVTGVEK